MLLGRGPWRSPSSRAASASPSVHRGPGRGSTMGFLLLPPLCSPCSGAEVGGRPGPWSSVLPPRSGASSSAGHSPWSLCWGPGPAVEDSVRQGRGPCTRPRPARGAGPGTLAERLPWPAQRSLSSRARTRRIRSHRHWIEPGVGTGCHTTAVRGHHHTGSPAKGGATELGAGMGAGMGAARVPAHAPRRLMHTTALKPSESLASTCSPTQAWPAPLSPRVTPGWREQPVTQPGGWFPARRSQAVPSPSSALVHTPHFGSPHRPAVLRERTTGTYLRAAPRLLVHCGTLPSHRVLP